MDYKQKRGDANGLGSLLGVTSAMTGIAGNSPAPTGDKLSSVKDRMNTNLSNGKPFS